MILAPPHPATADLLATLLAWSPFVAGPDFMYGPSIVDLFRGIWSTDEQAHGPIVFGVSCWLVWRNWPAMWARSAGARTSAAGWSVVVIAAPAPEIHQHGTVAQLSRRPVFLQSGMEQAMPTISMFYGILVSMYVLDTQKHPLPHIHVRYAEHKTVIEIPSGNVLEGSLPSKQMKLLQAWIALHADELMADWELAASGETPYKIEPLR